jgi:hypothetical protein
MFYNIGHRTKTNVNVNGMRKRRRKMTCQKRSKFKGYKKGVRNLTTIIKITFLIMGGADFRRSGPSSILLITNVAFINAISKVVIN